MCLMLLWVLFDRFCCSSVLQVTALHHASRSLQVFHILYCIVPIRSPSEWWSKCWRSGFEDLLLQENKRGHKQGDIKTSWETSGKTSKHREGESVGRQAVTRSKSGITSRDANGETSGRQAVARNKLAQAGRQVGRQDDKV